MCGEQKTEVVLDYYVATSGELVVSRPLDTIARSSTQSTCLTEWGNAHLPSTDPSSSPPPEYIWVQGSSITVHL